MRNYLDILLEELLSSSKVNHDCIEKDLHTNSQKQVKLEFRKILDRLIYLPSTCTASTGS